MRPFGVVLRTQIALKRDGRVRPSNPIGTPWGRSNGPKWAKQPPFVCRVSTVR